MELPALLPASARSRSLLECLASGRILRSSSAALIGCFVVACSADPQALQRSPDDDGPDPAADGGTVGEVDGGRPGRDAGTPPGEAPKGSYQEVFDQGITRWSGTPQVEATNVTQFGFGAKAENKTISASVSARTRSIIVRRLSANAAGGTPPRL